MCPFFQRIQKLLGIPESIAFTGFLNPLSRGQLAGLSFEPSVLMVGAGMLMGPRVTLSMLAGSTLLYYVVAPAMAAHDDAQASIPGYIASFTYRPDGSFNPVRWGLWGGTSLMVFASLTVLALEWRTFARAFSMFRGRSTGASANDRELAAIEVPGRWLVYGLVPFGIGTVIVLKAAFAVPVPLGILAVLLTVVVSLVCCRATGETDTTPIGPMGKLTQLVYGILPGAAGNTVINLMTAGATTSAGMGSADLLTDLKSGYLLGANPRKQFLAQFFGVFIGTLAIVPAWYLMVPTKEALEAFNPPATNMWKAVADLLTKGLSSLPPSALWIIAIGAGIGVLLPLLERLTPRLRPLPAFRHGARLFLGFRFPEFALVRPRRHGGVGVVPHPPSQRRNVLGRGRLRLHRRRIAHRRRHRHRLHPGRHPRRPIATKPPRSQGFIGTEKVRNPSGRTATRPTQTPPPRNQPASRWRPKRTPGNRPRAGTTICRTSPPHSPGTPTRRPDT
jgi:hypothetical protein